jgi:cyclopropane fatty-acyl-phospholipid synthase-like methyltransferase
MMRTDAEAWRLFYNNIYAHPRPGFSTQPNALLLATVAGRAPGRALDICTGQGRNAVFLASQGWDVTAVDVSDEGLEVAMRSAERAGVRMRTVRARTDDFVFGTVTWDLIVAVYAPVPLTDAGYAQRISEGLRPGGVVVIESFASEASEADRTPVDIDPAELQRAFGSLRVLRFEDTVAMPDWGTREWRLCRFVAEKQSGRSTAA